MINLKPSNIKLFFWTFCKYTLCKSEHN